MFRFKKSFCLALMLGMTVPVCSNAANFCIAVNGGFGNGGSSFVGKGFAVPAAGTCKPWSGYVKTGASAIANSTGSGCVSTDGKVLTLTIISTDPPFLGTGVTATDHIRICPPGVTSCPLGAGQDAGTFGGIATTQNCTASLLKLPAIHQ
jgi:hypothetical protein